MIEDIEALKQDGQAIVVYHHQTHRKGGHYVELRDLAMRLRTRGFLVSGVLRAKPWSLRAFFILNEDDALRSRAVEIAATWDRRICWIPDPAAEWPAEAFLARILDLALRLIFSVHRAVESARS